MYCTTARRRAIPRNYLFFPDYFSVQLLHFPLFPTLDQKGFFSYSSELPRFDDGGEELFRGWRDRKSGPRS